ncbi:MAG: hypothetical protein JJE22_19160 [Bacteroidia bacterium]|nr:hypothetical protein [Bacteroidia bacterium]
MKNFSTVILFLLLGSCSYSQQLGQVTFSGGAKLSYLAFLTDQGVLIRVTDDGKIMEWGTEVQSQRSDYYAPKLQPYMGRIEYYGPEADSAFKGKLKSVGTCTLTYYGHYETATKIGKLKTVGTLNLDYYDNFDNATLRGKLRFIGSQILEYYSPTVDEAFRGKLRSIGNTQITYYSSFDDKAIKGKIKSIGAVSYAWYTSFDLNRSGLKSSGLYRQNIGGVTYILR